MRLQIFKRFLIGLTAVIAIAALSAAPARSAIATPVQATATSSSAPATVEYVGGFGGSVAGLAVNGAVAYIGEGASLTVLDIGDAAHPTRHARLPLADLPADLALAGGRLYVAGGSAGLLIYDVSDPLAPQLLGSFPTPQAATRVRAQGTVAYVVAGDLLVVDVQHPAAPHQLGSFHASRPINNLAVFGSRVYLATGTTGRTFSGSLSILDVANPTAPSALGGIVLSQEAAVDVQAEGNLIYVIIGADSLSGLRSSRLLIADVSNAASPAILSAIALPRWTLAVDRVTLLVANGMAYVAGFPDGLLTYDVHIPEAISLVSQSTSLGGSAGLQLVGEQLYAVTDGIGYVFPGFQIISLHTPANPVQIGGYETFSNVQGVDVANGIANMTHYSRGFQLVDVHDPARPFSRGAYAIYGVPSRMQLVGNLTYLVGGNGGLNILDVSNPDNPVRLGGIPPNGSTMDIRIVENRAYIPYIHQLAIMDISNPTDPVQLGTFSQVTGYPDTGVDVVGSRAYFATGNQGLVVVDISDPAHPLARGSYTALSRASHVQVVGNRAYVAAGQDGLIILDLANPDSPTLLGAAHGPQFANYVRVVNGLAYVADYYGGIQIFDVHDPASPVIIADYHSGGSVTSVDVLGDLIYIPAGVAGLQIVRLHLDQPASSTQVGPAGGTVATADGTINLDIPPDALSSTATVTLTPTLAPPLQPDAGGLLRSVTLDARDSQGQPIDHFDRPYTLTISYTDEDLAAQQIGEAGLHMLFWNGSAWVAPQACGACGVDTALNRATVAADQVGAFALLGGTPPKITSGAPPAMAIVHRPFRHIFAANGSPAPTFGVAAGVLPPGLSLDPATGVLDGIPSAPGTFAFTIGVSNGLAPDAAQSVTLVVRSELYLPLLTRYS